MDILDFSHRAHGKMLKPTPEDARLPARRAYSSERRAVISMVIVTARREFMKYPG